MRRLTLPVLATLLLASPALAVPGDPPIRALSPQDGATVGADAGGIRVTFTCPAYTKRASDGLFPPETGGPADYDAAFARSPAVGSDGRLAETAASGAVRERAGEPGVCDADLGARAFPAPQSTPGTYHWQAWRECASCAGGYETGPVVRFVIRAAGEARLQAPARAYAGYPFVVVASYTDDAADRIRVQRRAGSRWRTITTTTGNAAPIIRLERGRQTLRALAEIGGDTVAGAARTVTVAPARRWRTSRRDDGSYRDRRRPSVRFTVTGGGRRISGFRADVPTLCGDPSSPTGSTPGVSRVTLPPVRIAPDGRFAVQGRYRGATVRFTGRLAKRRLSGTRVAIATTACEGSIAVEARRTG